MVGFLKKLFGKPEPRNADFSMLGADIHSHLIPGIDDGAQTMEDSIAMIRELHRLGFRKLITTPHVMSDAYKNTPEIILGGLEKLRVAVQEAGIDVELGAAAEYYLDEAFEKMARESELLTFGGEHKYVLFETSYVNRPLSLETTIFELNTRGFKPVLAHPERYAYFWDKEIEDVLEVRRKGVLFQVNLGSFMGAYSRRAARIANGLVEANAVDFVGTDIHRITQIRPMTDALEMSDALNNLLDAGTLLNRSLVGGDA